MDPFDFLSLSQTPFLLGIVFVFGVIWGSFLNVVILRTQEKKSLGGRSICPSCKKTLRAWMLVPVLSWLGLRGRCGFCRASISAQYPIIEVASGLLAVLAVLWSGGFLAAALSFFALWALLGISLIDLRTMIVPDVLAIPFLGASLAICLLRDGWHGLLAGLLVALPFTLLWALSRGRAMGFGDGEIALGMGWFLGLTQAATAAIISFWIALPFALFLLFARRKHYTMKSEIPFGPFLAAGTLVVFLCHIDLFSLIVL